MFIYWSQEPVMVLGSQLSGVSGQKSSSRFRGSAGCGYAKPGQAQGKAMEQLEGATHGRLKVGRRGKAPSTGASAMFAIFNASCLSRKPRQQQGVLYLHFISMRPLLGFCRHVQILPSIGIEGNVN